MGRVGAGLGVTKKASRAGGMTRRPVRKSRKRNSARDGLLTYLFGFGQIDHDSQAVEVGPGDFAVD